MRREWKEGRKERREGQQKEKGKELWNEQQKKKRSCRRTSHHFSSLSTFLTLVSSFSLFLASHGHRLTFVPHLSLPSLAQGKLRFLLFHSPFLSPSFLRKQGRNPCLCFRCPDSCCSIHCSQSRWTSPISSMICS